MLKRYLIGLASAFGLFVTAFSGVVLITAPASRVRIPDVVGVAMVFGAIGTLVLSVVGALIIAAGRLFRRPLRPSEGALVGAVLSPLSLFAVWFMFREGNETAAGTLTYWARLPMEFVLGVLPHALASASFAAWILRPR